MLWLWRSDVPEKTEERRGYWTAWVKRMESMDGRLLVLLACSLLQRSTRLSERSET